MQARNRQYNENLESRYELRYFLSPYKPSAFEGKEPERTDGRYVRFFETEGHLEVNTGRVSARIARFDIHEPVVFYYSANTPSNYVDAVKDGILYWNSAFGKELVQAKKAPDGVTAPDAELNIIQWVPWDYAGFAYADDLMDPLSGQSEHGQAYITSAFAFGGRSSARSLLRAMEELAEAKKDDKKKDLSMRQALPFLASGPSCDSCGSWPNSSTLPASARIKPSSRPIAVVLPAPLGPRSASSSPRRTTRSAPSSAVSRP